MRKSRTGFLNIAAIVRISGWLERYLRVIVGRSKGPDAIRPCGNVRPQDSHIYGSTDKQILKMTAISHLIRQSEVLVFSDAAVSSIAATRHRPVVGGNRIGPRLVRGRSDNHGHADWLAIRNARRLFPGPDETHGGIVVGEAYRVDQDRVARRAFDPTDRPEVTNGPNL